MARKPQNKNYSLSYGEETNKSFHAAGFGVVKSDGTIAGPFRFLINPDTISETKSVNWAGHTVPGQNAPVYQWVSGGPRVVSFEALVTKDTREFPFDSSPDPDPQQLLGESVLNVMGSIASAFLGVSLPPLSGLLNKLTGGGDGLELSIEKTLDFYRTLQKAKYNKDGKLETSPPLVVLYLGTSLGLDVKPAEKIDKYTELWILTQLDTKITKWLPNLSPMEAIVTFQFTEYKITSTKNDTYG